jgi:hypothetical protein
MRKRLLSYGLSDFARIRRDNCYFVDKTEYIAKLERVRYPVFLRPRRFGKTVFTSMLRCYYDLKMADRFSELFDGLAIGKEPTGLQNSYYFLHFDFSGMNAGDNLEECRKCFNVKVYGTVSYFLDYYQKELQFSPEKRADFSRQGSDNASYALSVAIDAVNLIGGRLFVAVDEYDSLTNAMAIKNRNMSKEDSEYQKALDKGGFFRAFFEELKASTVKCVEQIYITGILPVTISDMNSGFNIGSFINSRKSFVNMLGITESELLQLYDEIALDYEMPMDKSECLKLMKRYYDGYCFLPEETKKVYNPMMTIYFLDSLIMEGTVPANLADANLRTGFNQVSHVFGADLEKRDNIITHLTENGEIEFSENMDITFSMHSMADGRYALQGLYYMGILTWKGQGQNRLQVPNLVTYEMMLSYFEQVKNFLPIRNEMAAGFTVYRESGDLAAFCAPFFETAIKKFPGAFFKDANESFYRGLFFHILYDALEKNNYDIYSEFQMSRGQVDFYIRSHPQAKVPFALNDLIEIKRVKAEATDAELEAKFQKAVSQVQARREAAYKGMRCWAICFRGNRDYKIGFF